MDQQIISPNPPPLELHAAVIINSQMLLDDIQTTIRKDLTYLRFLKTGKGLKLNHWSRKEDGLILHNDCVFVLDNKDLRLHVLKSKHDHKLAGHLGQSKTFQLVQRHYSWPNLKSFVIDYIRSCNACSRNKSRRHKPYSLLKQLPIPPQPWKSISMDFIEQLPESEGYTDILVVIDRLMKQAVFMPTRRTINAKELSKVFIREMFSKHSTPTHVTSDRGSEFISKFFRALANTLDIKLYFTSGYYPEADGQTKCTNQMLEQYLRIFCTYQQSDWVKLLPLAEFCFNNSFLATTNISPFFANKGYHLWLEFQLDRELYPDIAEPYLANLEKIYSRLKKSIVNMQARYQRWENKQRFPALQIKIRDQVFVLVKFIRTTRPSRKLSEKYLGLFKVTRQPDTHSYLIRLPEHLRSIYLVFHISQLEPTPSSQIPNCYNLPPPPIEIAGHLKFEVAQILDSKLDKQQKDPLLYYICWAGYEGTPKEYSWLTASNLENATKLLADFHHHYLDKPSLSLTSHLGTDRLTRDSLKTSM